MVELNEIYDKRDKECNVSHSRWMSMCITTAFYDTPVTIDGCGSPQNAEYSLGRFCSANYGKHDWQKPPWWSVTGCGSCPHWKNCIIKTLSLQLCFNSIILCKLFSISISYFSFHLSIAITPSFASFYHLQLSTYFLSLLPLLFTLCSSIHIS